MNIRYWEKPVEYKGYIIKFCSVWKDGEPMVMFYVPLDTTFEEYVRIGKRIVDERISRVERGINGL